MGGSTKNGASVGGAVVVVVVVVVVDVVVKHVGRHKRSTLGATMPGIGTLGITQTPGEEALTFAKPNTAPIEGDTVQLTAQSRAEHRDVIMLPKKSQAICMEYVCMFTVMTEQ